MTPERPPEIAGYTELRQVGHGGFSRVFEAYQSKFDRQVAVKVLNMDLIDAHSVENFERECRAMGALSTHPNIVTVLESDFTTDNRPCIVMELFRNGTYMERLRRSGPLDTGALLSLGVKIAGALETAHRYGVLHRDVKPQNLFISEFGEPALGDFGISTVVDERTAAGPSGLTVHYAPPELIEGEEAGPRSDLYSLAASLFTLASGHRPFGSGDTSETAVSLAVRVLSEPAPRLPGGEFPIAFCDLLQRSMSKSPGDRPDTMIEFARALNAVETDLRQTPTPTPVPESTAEHYENELEELSFGVGEHHGDNLTVTVAKRQAIPTDASEPTPPRQPATAFRRATIATGIGFASVALVFAAAFVGFSDSDNEPAAPSTTLGPTPTTDAFFEFVDDVEGVAGVVADGTATFTWEPVVGDVTYRVSRVDGDHEQDAPIRTTSPEIEIRNLDASDFACIVVRAVNANGRQSPPTAPVCATPE